MKFQNLSTLVLTLFFFVAQVQAQTLIDPHRTTREGAFDLGGVVSFSEIEYEGDGGGEGDVERKILGVTGAYGLSRQLNLYGELGYIVEAEPENGDDDDGFLLGVGFRGAVCEENRHSVILRAGVRYINESYGRGTDVDLIDLEVGAAARYDINDKFSAYGGLDIYPISEGESEFAGLEFDFERDDFFGLRVGGDYQLSRVALNAEIGLVGEQALIFRVKVPM